MNIIAALRCKDRETAITAFKIVRFKTTKSDRRLHWLQTKATQLQKGEYGVYFLGNMFGVNQAIQCYTFAIE
ncbi:hypothetical protein [Prevotella melaninogenica]|uniref:hypothetical protein n=1 Tax=Prevotella melaninogenica TaxID=28132 RepID=UPI001C5FA528|nr:hypothetical protein [Prevotella melaninogenica]